MIVMINIPFETAPRELIESFPNCPFTYEEYLQCCDIFNDLPTYWNMAILDGEEIVHFSWGIHDPLDRFLHAVRGATKSRYREEVRPLMYAALYELKNEYGALNVFFISCYTDEMVKNAFGRLKLADGKVVEVMPNENLH